MDISIVMIGAIILLIIGAIIGFFLGVAVGPQVMKMFDGSRNVQTAQKPSSEKNAKNDQTPQTFSPQQQLGQQNGTGNSGNKSGKNLKHGQNKNGQAVITKEGTKPDNEEKAEGMNAAKVESMVSNAVNRQMEAYKGEMRNEFGKLGNKLIEKLLSEVRVQIKKAEPTPTKEPTVKETIEIKPIAPKEPEIQIVAPKKGYITKYVQLSDEEKKLREDDSLDYCIYFVSVENQNSTAGELFVRDDLSEERMTEINNYRFRYLAGWVCSIKTDCGTPKSMKTSKPGRVVKNGFDWVVESPVEIELI